MSSRLPELCTEYVKPKQNHSIMVNPTNKMNQIILPQKVQVNDNLLVEKVGVIVEPLVNYRTTKQV